MGLEVIGIKLNITMDILQLSRELFSTISQLNLSLSTASFSRMVEIPFGKELIEEIFLHRWFII